MSLTLVVESGEAKSDSNTYISLEDATAYMEGRIGTGAWDGATDADKNASLVQSARILDRYVEWVGVVTDDAQAMEWPRQYVPDPRYKTVDALGFYVSAGDYFLPKDEIPQQVKDAQCELALVLLSQDTQAIADMAGYSQVNVEGAVDITADKADRPGEIPSHVWKIVSMFGEKHHTSTRLERT